MASEEVEEPDFIDYALGAAHRIATHLAFVLFLGMLFAWVLGVLGLNRPYVERIALSVISEYVAIYVIAEGTNIAFDRCFGLSSSDEETGDDDGNALARLPEAEQIAKA